MDDLIKIDISEGKFPIDARELWEKLGSQRQFVNWIQERIEKWDFIEGEDFLTNLLKSTGGRPGKEYKTTINMAKELCMIENNDNGKMIRRYFIAKEEELLEIYRRGYVHLPNFETRKQILNTYAKNPSIKNYQKRRLLESLLWNIGIDKNIIPSGDREHPIGSRMAAWYLGVSMSTVQKYTRNGIIPHTVIFGMKRYFERDLRKLLDKGFFPGREDENLLGFDEDETEGNVPIQ